MNADTLDYKQMGGRLMPQAKSIYIDAIGVYVPQHYYVYQQNLDSLNTILSMIQSLPNIMLFAAEDETGLYLQVGVIGQENYLHLGKGTATKLVYGRKWRIDRDTPASEVVQTALLAIQKVREHEVRELLNWQDPDTGKRSTPFSCHQDIQLLSRVLASAPQQTAEPVGTEAVLALLQQLRFGSSRFILQQWHALPDGRCLMDVRLDDETGATPHFAEFSGHLISVILPGLSAALLMHQLMDALIQHSHNHCRDTFLFSGIARFSQQVDPRLIGRLSVKSRPYQQHLSDSSFARTFAQCNFAIDQGRVPPLGQGPLAEQNRRTILRYTALEGHLPAGIVSEFRPAVRNACPPWRSSRDSGRGGVAQ